MLLLTTTGCTQLDSLLRSIFSPDAHPYARSVPDQPIWGMSGRAFLEKTSRYSQVQREEAIYQQLIAGNMPNFLRSLQPIKTSKTIAGRRYNATLYVTPDYLAIGPDDDYVYIPMNPKTAQRIASRWEFVLPTTKIVDMIYHQAKLKLSPKPLPPGPQMVTNSYYLRHHQIVAAQTSRAKVGQIIAGHKKDVVLTKRLLRRRGRVAIYGWHRPNGRPIQPLSLVHGDYYADYSHGIRLVSKWVVINGKVYSFQRVLSDPRLSKLISYEGPFGRVNVARSSQPEVP